MSSSTLQVSVMDALTTILPLERVSTDPSDIDYFSQDYFRKGVDTLAIAVPETAEELSRVIAATTEKGLAIFPRGGGYSYTDGYTPTLPGITLDLRNMNKILEINAEDMYVTVEPGCTWAKLNDALKARQLRTPFWGTFSGLNATVGGSISQGSLSWGSSKYGVSSETVLDLEVVAADGSIFKTGTSGQPGHKPFFRNYGPDLTGLFCSDCGALGVKSAITLRLIKRPAHMLGLSFGFSSFDIGAEAAARVAREGITSDSFGMFQERATAAAEKTSLADDLESLWKIGKTGSGPIDAGVRMAKVAFAGRRFLKNAPFSFHFIVDGANKQTVQGYAKTIRALIGSSGEEMPNTIPSMARADPFLNYGMLSSTGQRQLAPSTILPLSAAKTYHQAFTAAIKPHADAMKRCNMNVLAALSTIGTNGFLYEPVIAWDDAPDEFHRRHSSDALLKIADAHKPDMEARALANTIRQIMIDTAYEHGGIHVQIGKVYPYLRDRNETAMSLLKDVKQRMDPQGLMNTGALGLPV